MNRRLAGILPLGLVGLAAACPAVAQLFVGQHVTMGHYLPNDATVFDGPYAVTVAADATDRQLVSPFADHHKGYGVDIGADRVVIDFIGTVHFTAGPSFHGLVIHNLATGGTPTVIETAPHRLFAYDGSTLKIDWQNITVPNGATYTILFASVPEPAHSAAATALALAAFGCWWRRTRSNA